MKPLIKWAGGKSSEIKDILPFFPHNFVDLVPQVPNYNFDLCNKLHKNRYIEPFFGGGAVFFHLQPQMAAINDISYSLMQYYQLIKQQDKQLYSLLVSYNNSFLNLINVCNENYIDILNIYNDYSIKNLDIKQIQKQLLSLIENLFDKILSGFTQPLILDNNTFIITIQKNVLDKIQRIYKNNLKKPFSEEDIKNNLITGFTSGYYMYFRDIYNAINLNKIKSPSIQYKAANFYFIREYCYGSMFRYNAKGEFNIPYGGISYNKKNMQTKIDNMFCKEINTLFANTEIYCSDFETFFDNISLNNNDFMFLDPPYDTEFSDYEGNDFTKLDQERLAYCLKKVQAQFLLVIKNTDFIKNLYSDFNIMTFDKQYTYNMRNRNNRDVQHLIITNYN